MNPEEILTEKYAEKGLIVYERDPLIWTIICGGIALLLLCKCYKQNSENAQKTNTSEGLFLIKLVIAVSLCAIAGYSFYHYEHQEAIKEIKQDCKVITQIKSDMLNAQFVSNDKSSTEAKLRAENEALSQKLREAEAKYSAYKTSADKNIAVLETDMKNMAMNAIDRLEEEVIKPLEEKKQALEEENKALKEENKALKEENKALKKKGSR